MITLRPAGHRAGEDVVVIGTGSQPKDATPAAPNSTWSPSSPRAGGKVVVAGDTGSAQGNGVVAVVRNGPAKSTVSTVDNADTAFGQVSTALAMAGAVNSQVGHYGTRQGRQALFPTTSK